MTQSYAITEPTRNLRALLLAFTVVPTILVLVVLYAVVRPALPPVLPPALLAMVIVQNLVIGRLIERRMVSLEGTRLGILAGMSRQDLDIATIDLEHARVLRLDEHPEFKPFLRTGGVGMPGLSLGWFRTRNLTRIFCLLTDRQRVLLLPLRGNKEAVLLSLQRPEELLSALRVADDSRQQRR